MRTLWLTCPMADTLLHVFVASPDDPGLQLEGEDGPAEGMSLRTESIILINSDVPVRRRLGVLMHELGHMALFLTGIGPTVKLTDAREEALISAIAPLMTHALVGAGLLRGRRLNT